MCSEPWNDWTDAWESWEESRLAKPLVQVTVDDLARENLNWVAPSWEGWEEIRLAERLQSRAGVGPVLFSISTSWEE